MGKDPDAGKDWRQEKKGMTGDEMVGWHHQLNGHKFEWALGVGDEQGSLQCCSRWDHRVGHDWVAEVNWKGIVKVEKRRQWVKSGLFQEMVNINTIKEATALATDFHTDESNGKVSILFLTAQKYSIWLNVSFLLIDPYSFCFHDTTLFYLLFISLLFWIFLFLPAKCERALRAEIWLCSLKKKKEHLR